MTIITIFLTKLDVRNQNEKEERLRILKAATEIIREDIRFSVFGNATYSSLNECFKMLTVILRNH